MKLLLLIVSVMAVFTADCRDLAGGPVKSQGDSANNDQNYTDVPPDRDSSRKDPVLQEGTVFIIDGPKDNDSAEVDQQLETPSLLKAGLKGPHGEEEKVHSKGQLRRSQCKARNACVVMGGFCVTNATLCSGRLVAEGCKGITCQCCVPGTLELKIESYEMELQSLKNKLTENDLELKMEIQTLIKNNTESNTNLKMELQSMKINISRGFSDMASALQHLGPCPGGFFKSAGSSQCFKLLSDSKCSWIDARAKCRAEGLTLAEPSNAVAVSLRKDIIDKYGSGSLDLVWLDARADNRGKFMWQRGGTELRSDSNLWYPNHPGSRTSTDYCLCLMTRNASMQSYPADPYFSCSGCTSYGAYPLCEN